MREAPVTRVRDAGYAASTGPRRSRACWFGCVVSTRLQTRPRGAVPPGYSTVEAASSRPSRPGSPSEFGCDAGPGVYAARGRRGQAIRSHRDRTRRTALQVPPHAARTGVVLLTDSRISTPQIRRLLWDRAFSPRTGPPCASASTSCSTWPRRARRRGRGVVELAGVVLVWGRPGQATRLPDFSPVTK